MFNLTQDEKRVILFLSAVLFIGMGISFAAKRNVKLQKILVADSNSGKINLNEVSLEELLRLRIFSPKLSREIITYRDGKGRLESLEELKGIKRMSGERIEKLDKFFFLR